MTSFRKGIAVMSLMVLATSGVARSQWNETFDSYAKGFLDPQSDWEQWLQGTGTDAVVVDSFALSLPHSVEVKVGGFGGTKGDDIVYDFVHLPGGQPTSGKWICTAQTYVPSTATGTGFFIMLNRYPSQLDWSVQLRFETGLGRVQTDSDAGTGSGDLALITDQWVPLYTCIDLDNDRVDIYYGFDLLAENASWVNGTGAGGSQQIACIDLYAGEPGQGGITGIYLDNMVIEKTKGPCFIVSSDPNPAQDGDLLTVQLSGPMLGSQTAALFVWEVLGNPFVFPVALLPLNANGEFQVSFTVQPGLAGLDIGFKSFATVPGGGIAESNVENLYFQ